MINNVQQLKRQNPQSAFNSLRKHISNNKSKENKTKLNLNLTTNKLQKHHNSMNVLSFCSNLNRAKRRTVLRVEQRQREIFRRGLRLSGHQYRGACLGLRGGLLGIHHFPPLRPSVQDAAREDLRNHGERVSDQTNRKKKQIH